MRWLIGRNGRLYGGRLGPVPKSKIENQNSHIPYTYSQASCTFAAHNWDYPEACAYEIHAYKVYAREMHAYKVHTCEMHAHEIHACEMHAREVHAYEIHASDMHACEACL